MINVIKFIQSVRLCIWLNLAVLPFICFSFAVLFRWIWGLYLSFYLTRSVVNVIKRLIQISQVTLYNEFFNWISFQWWTDFFFLSQKLKKMIIPFIRWDIVNQKKNSKLKYKCAKLTNCQYSFKMWINFDEQWFSHMTHKSFSMHTDTNKLAAVIWYRHWPLGILHSMGNIEIIKR